MTTRSESSIETMADIWSSLESYIPTKQKQQAAEQFVRVLEEAGYDKNDLDELGGISNHLEKAIQLIFEDDDYDSEY